MQIGILETGHAPDALRPDLGDYADLFEGLLSGHDFTFRRYDVEAQEMPASPQDCDGWLITGSRHGAYEDHPWIPPLEAFIRAVREAEVPMVGICFGHQIIAQALGGRVEKFAGGWAVGRQLYDFGGEAVALNAWHQDQVTVAPPGARAVAASAFCENAALLYSDRIWSIQPHPEFDARFIRGLIEHRGGAVPEDRLSAAEAALERPTDSARIADHMAQILKGLRA
ncbi:type 1 glutamine amidotransferase [Pseudoroseicyclus aestuarii]|uniref:GMP synthase-like glutamine amidotransferase n=1 Tax=Pseudoroseicyclus aestuarii TaxID=1795041 RepID=A0A318SW23_9RHOB|nr:type 1 glutamine amidotransferase [Pseudoroseicyclus aestuarii]PYE85692.1 GMP synthase-like glutamine amidotransferase [Pseudoroseicyclus aestuarii]